MTKSFNKEKHEYLIDGKPATGVTSVIGVLAKPALIQWAANEAVKHVALNEERFRRVEGDIFQFLPEEFLEVLNEAQGAHIRKKEAAGTHGTDSHALVESYVKACIEQFGGKPVKPLERDAIAPFTDWACANVDHFLFAERVMFNKDLFIAGTADFGCVMKDGKKLIGDYKTSSGQYDIGYFLQCAGYKILAEGEGDTPYDGCVIVRQGKKGPEDFDVTYRYDTKADEEGFRACLTLYRLQATYVKPNNN